MALISGRRLTASVVIFAATQSAFADIKYRLLNVGSGTTGYALNDYGQVVGTGPTAGGGFLTSANAALNTGTDDLGELYTGLGGVVPYAVNNYGQVAGKAPWDSHTPERQRAFFFDSGTITDIDGITSGSVAYSINSSGVVAGVGTSSTGDPIAIQGTSGGITSLGVGTDSSWAYSINNAGDIVGLAVSTSGPAYAFRYNAATSTVTNLQSSLSISGAATVYSSGLRINNNGDVLIGVTAYDNVGAVVENDLVILHSNNTVTHIPTFYDEDGAEARLDHLWYGMNDAGKVVGVTRYNANPEVPVAFYFDGTTTWDLNDLIDPATGVVLLNATDINESGQILANGLDGTIDPAYVLTPITNSTWTGAGTTWSSSSNWSSGVPKEVLDQAHFLTQSGQHNVNLDINVKVGTLVLNDATTGYSIGSSAGHTITFETQGSWAQLKVLAGSHTISAPVVLAKHTEVATSSGTSLSITGTLSGSAALLKSGAGSLTVNNLRLPAVTVDGGALHVAAAGTNAGTSKVGELTVNTSNSAKLDLADNDLVVDYTGTSPLSTVRTLLASGYNSGAWNGVGINSSSAAAAAGTSAPTALGYGEATTILGLSGTSTATWSGQTVDATAVLIKYTYLGDANLDGQVDLSDLNAVLNHFGMPSGTANWSDGDFNYDGNVDLSDLNAVNNYFGNGAGSPLAASALSVVPEPSMLGFLAVLPIAAHRRRRSR